MSKIPSPEHMPLKRREATAGRSRIKAVVAGLLAMALLVEPVQLQILPTAAVELTYLALVAVFLGAILLGYRMTRVEFISFCLLAIVLAYAAVRGNLLLSLLGTVWILKPILAFLAGALLAGKRAEELVARVGLLGSLLVSSTIFLEASGLEWMGTSKGFSGIYSGVAQAAHAGVLGLLLVPKRQRTRLWWFAAALIVVGVALTQSRHGLVLAAVAVLPIIAIRRFMHVRWLARLLIVLALLIIAVATVGQTTVGRFAEVQQIIGGREYYRLHALQVALVAGEENAGLGVGPGRFGGPVANRFFPEGKYQQELTRFWIWRDVRGGPTTTDLAVAHVIGELGYVGFCLLYGWGLLLALERKKRGEGSPIHPPRALLVVAGASFFTFAPITNGPLQLVFLILGLRRQA